MLKIKQGRSKMTICKKCKFHNNKMCFYYEIENTKSFYDNVFVIEKCEEINNGNCIYYKKGNGEYCIDIKTLKYNHCEICKNGTVNCTDWICHKPYMDYVTGKIKYERRSRDYNKYGKCEDYVYGENNYMDAKLMV
jgi:hypothetical protein